MSWHFLQEQEEASWEGNSLDGAPSALLKLMPTADQFCLRVKETASLTHSQYGMTLRRLTGTRGAASLMWYQGDSPVRTYLPPEGQIEKGSQGNDPDYGPSLPGSLAKYNPHLYLWKTRQCLLFAGLASFSETWPRWGMMRDGECWERTTQGVILIGNASGLLPAPVKNMGEGFLGGPIRSAETWETTSRLDHLLIGIWKKWTGRENGGKLGEKVICHPTFAEWTMLWPMNWTNLKPLATDKFQQWVALHGKC